MSHEKVAIGIDLGTSKCCVGVVRDGRVEILENERSCKTTPSYVAFTDTERLVGEDAKDQATLNPTNTVFGVKGIIGRKPEDCRVKNNIKYMPYSIVNKADETYIDVTYKGEEEALLPQQVTAMLLTKMKDLAQDRLGCSVEEAVISVPASFSNAQRQATKDAATIAGLKVLALINEPTAAAVAYQANRKEEAEETIAVVDFGGGKLDVAIVSVSNSCVAVKGMSGTMDMGGNVVDEILMEYVLGKFREKFSREPVMKTTVFERLRGTCVKLKHVLSLLTKVQYQLDCFGDVFVLPIAINRAEYTDLISNKISLCLSTHLTCALQMSGLNKQNISRVVLVGGSTRIPLVPEKIKTLFDESQLESTVNPDETVAQGAAIYASILNGDSNVPELGVNDLLLNSFCFADEASCEVQEIFCNHTVIPATKKVTFKGKDISQRFDLYEELSGGRGPRRLIGTMCLSEDFNKAVRLVTAVVFEICKCGIFDVIVHLGPMQDANYAFRDLIKRCSGRLSSERLLEAIEREHLFRHDEKEEKNCIKRMKQFPDLVPQVNTEAVDTIDGLDTELKFMKSDCQTEIKSLDKIKEKVAIKELRSYSTEVATFLTNSDITEVADVADEIKKQLNLLDEWLQTETDHSDADCDDKREALDNVLRTLEQALELKKQEREREASVNDLRAYCSELQLSLSTKPSFESDLQLVNVVCDQAKEILQWLDSNESASTEECSKIKASLNDNFKPLQRRADKLEREREEELENERFDVANILWGRCHDFRSKVRLSNIDSYDAPLAKHIFAEVDTVIHWLTKAGKLASKAECAKETELIMNYEEMFANWAKEHEEKVLLQKRENELIDAHRKVGKERSVTFKEEEAEGDDDVQKEVYQCADGFEEECAETTEQQEKAYTEAAKKHDKEHAAAIKKQAKERASAVRKQAKADTKLDKERAKAAKKAK